MHKEKLSCHEICRIIYITTISLVKAFKIRHSKAAGSFSLPSADTEVPASESKIKKIVFLADIVIFVFMFWKPGKCFYRSYALATLLRMWGMTLVINFGCENLYESNGKPLAHCWLTHNGVLFSEKTDPYQRFPIEIESKNQDIKYWLGDDSKPKKLRDKVT